MNEPVARSLGKGGWLSLVLVCVAAFVIGGLLKQTGTSGTDVSDRLSVDRFLNETASPSYDPGEADVTMVVFTDYRCPACRAAHPEMTSAVARDGKVRIVYRDFPIFGPVSEQAARVALASDAQGIYPEIHDAFMRERRELTEPVIRELVQEVGGDWAQIERDIAGDPAIDAALERNRSDALRLGVSGTPTYLIGNYRIVGAMDEGEFKRAFERAREAAPD